MFQWYFQIYHNFETRWYFTEDSDASIAWTFLKIWQAGIWSMKTVLYFLCQHYVQLNLSENVQGYLQW